MSTTKPKVVIIHGNGGGTGEGCWIPWLAQQLTKKGFPVLNPTMPDNIEAKAAVWLPYMEKDLAIDTNTIIVGHSSGAVAAMRFAETHHILGSVLVGACHTDLGEESEKVSGYYDMPWDWKTIQGNQSWIVQFASQDDPFIPIKEARYIHEKLSTEYHEYTDREHFGWPTDVKEFPELLEVIERKAKSYHNK